MAHKHINRQLGELNHLIHRELVKNEQQNHHKFSDNRNLSPASSCIIAYLHDRSDEDVFQRDIEREFQVRRSTVSKSLSLLELKGYIERVPVEYDHRLKKIVLTKKAVSVADHLKSGRQQLEQKMLKGISDAELDAFKKTLEKIMKNLNEEVE